MRDVNLLLLMILRVMVSLCSESVSLAREVKRSQAIMKNPSKAKAEAVSNIFPHPPSPPFGSPTGLLKPVDVHNTTHPHVLFQSTVMSVCGLPFSGIHWLPYILVSAKSKTDV